MLNLALALTLVASQDLARDDVRDTLERVERTTPVVLVARSVRPSVVYIETETTQRVRGFWGSRDQVYAGSGSGVVIHREGFVVTNYHVVKGAQTITVSFSDSPEPLAAELVSAVRSEDLALLKIIRPVGVNPEDWSFPPVRLGTSSDLMEGERVVAIGNPHGQTHTVSTGIISGLHRHVPIPSENLLFKDLIQTDASINFGNSGGPLLNIRGELIGINTAMNSAAENIGFAIPVDRMREIVTDVLFPEARKGWLGFEVGTAVPLKITRVWPDSPADRAGICAGDTLVGLAGRRIQSMEEFLHASLEIQPGRDLAMTLSSPDQRDRVVHLTAWAKLDGVLFERMGLRVRESNQGGRSWVIIHQVYPNSPAAELGLEPGDLIPAALASEGRIHTPIWIRSKNTLAQLVSQIGPGGSLELDVYRDTNGDQHYAREELHQGTLVLR